jgi:hypothetical protein
LPGTSCRVRKVGLRVGSQVAQEEGSRDPEGAPNVPGDGPKGPGGRLKGAQRESPRVTCGMMRWSRQMQLDTRCVQLETRNVCQSAGKIRGNTCCVQLEARCAQLDAHGALRKALVSNGTQRVTSCAHHEFPNGFPTLWQTLRVPGCAQRVSSCTHQRLRGAYNSKPAAPAKQCGKPRGTHGAYHSQPGASIVGL